MDDDGLRGGVEIKSDKDERSEANYASGRKAGKRKSCPYTDAEAQRLIEAHNLFDGSWEAISKDFRDRSIGGVGLAPNYHS